MEETAKERRIRYALIFLFILLIAASFLFRANKQPNGELEATGMLALVLQESTEEKVNPIIALYKENAGQHMLIFYEIERDNEFRFEAQKAVTLRKAPTAMAKDQSDTGIWLKLGNKWIYFNQSLEQMKNDPKNIQKNVGQAVPFQKKRRKDQLHLSLQTINQQRVEVSLPNPKDPQKIFRLSENGKLWLIQYEEEIQVAQTMG